MYQIKWIQNVVVCWERQETMSQFSTLHINWVGSFIKYDIMKVKLVTCDCPKDMNTDTSMLITVLQNSVYL